MHVSAAEKAALVRQRAAWDRIRAEADAARDALLPQLRELDDPAVWLSDEARRVRARLHTASIGVRNRRDEAQQIVDEIDMRLRAGS
jgi:hypothetical protein